MGHANFRIVGHTSKVVIIEDLGPWSGHPTVTNDAEWVVSSLAFELRGRRLWYFDSEGNLDELLIERGKFVAFAAVRAI